MQYKVVTQLVQLIIKSIQNAAVFVVREIHLLPRSEYKVIVKNPQEKVEVSGAVSVDQKKVEDQLKDNATAIRELKKPLASLKEIKVSNMVKIPQFPKFPEFPKSFKVDNFPTSTKLSNIDVIVKAVAKLTEVLTKKEFSPVIKVDAPKVTVEAPVVNVPKQEPPVVNVEKPDLSELSKIIAFLESIGVKKPLAVRLSDGQQFYKALERMADIYAGSNNSSYQDNQGADVRGLVNKNHEVQVTSSDTWALNDTHQSGNINYLGEETVDGKWRITQATSSGDFVTMRYATPRNNSDYTDYTSAWDDHESLAYGRISEAL